MSKLDEEDSSKRRHVLPPDLAPDHVLGLIELLASLGGKIDSMYVGDAISEAIDVLPHAIDAAEALGLITVRSGDLVLTDLGRKVVRGDPKTVKHLLREVVMNLEPIAEIVEVLRERREVPAEEFDLIVEKYYPTNFEMARQNVLVWGAFLGLFKMDEDDKRVVALTRRRHGRTQGQ